MKSLSEEGSGAGYASGETVGSRAEDAVETVTDTLKDAYDYTLATKGNPDIESNPAFAGLDQNLQRLIQEMSSFRAGRELALSLPTPVITPEATRSVASMVTPTALFQG